VKTLTRHELHGRARLLRGTLITAASIAISVLTATTAGAQQQTEQQIKAGCDEANGTYSTVPNPDATYSVCCYHDYKGRPYCDTYVNGSYTGTFPGEAKPPPPVSGPAAPPANNAPIPTKPPPAAAH